MSRPRDPSSRTKSEKKGVSQIMVGVISAVTMFSMWIVSLALLFLASDRNKKCIFYFGLFTSAVTCIIFGELEQIDDASLFITLCLVTRALMGAGCGCIWGVGAAILIPLFPTEAGKIFGLLEFCAGFGQMAGPPFGSFLFSLGGYRFPFWTAGLIEITAGMFCVACLSTTHDPSAAGSGSSTPENQEKAFSKTSLNFLSNPGIILITLPVVTIMCEVGFFQVSLAPHLLKTFGIDGTTSGNIFLIHAGTSAVTCALFGVLVDKGYSSFAFIISTCLTPVGYFLIGFPEISSVCSSRLLLYLGLALLGLTANGGFVPGYFLFEKIAENAKIDCQAKLRIYVCAHVNSCYAFASIVGQILIGGFFFDAFNFYKSCLLLCGLSCASFIAGSVYLMYAGLLKRLYYTEDDINIPEEAKLLPEETHKQ